MNQSLSEKDLAEFALLGLKYKLLRLEQIVAWVDELIDERDNPPTWAIELAMASDAETAGSILRWIRGDVTPDLPAKLIGGLLLRRRDCGALNWRDVTGFVSDLYDREYGREEDLRLIPRQLAYDLIISEEWFYQHELSEADMDALVDLILLPFHDYEILLPGWAC